MGAVVVTECLKQNEELLKFYQKVQQQELNTENLVKV